MLINCIVISEPFGWGIGEEGNGLRDLPEDIYMYLQANLCVCVYFIR